MDNTSATASFTGGCLAKLELSDGNNLYAKLVVIVVTLDEIVFILDISIRFSNL